MKFHGLKSESLDSAVHEAAEDRGHTDLELIERLQRGDQAALDTLFSRYRQAVYAVCLRILNNADLAEDMLVDVFAELWRRPERFTGRARSVAASLLMFARQRAMGRADRQAPLRSASGQAEAPPVNRTERSRIEPAEASWIAERRMQARRALAMLPAGQREVVQYAFFDGLGHDDIAARLDLPVAIVKTRIHLGLARFRDELGGRNPRQSTDTSASPWASSLPVAAG